MKTPEIARAVLSAITDSEDFDRVIGGNPEAQEARQELDSALEAVREFCPEELFGQLENATIRYGLANNSISILCGMQIANGIYYATHTPDALAHFIDDYL